MTDFSELNKRLAYIDIFKFVITNDEDQLVANQISATKEANATASNKKVHKIECLDLADHLKSKKIVEASDSKPWASLQQILFERLMIEDYTNYNKKYIDIPHNESIYPSVNFVSTNPEFKSNDSSLIRYLYGCYYRCEQLASQIDNQNKDAIKRICTESRDLILNQACLYLTEPDIFPDRDKRIVDSQQAPLLLNLVIYLHSSNEPSHIETIRKFVSAIGELCKSMGDTGLEAIVGPTYAKLARRFVSIELTDPQMAQLFEITRLFLNQPDIAAKFLDKNSLKIDSSVAYQNTLLGYMLSISHLPRTSKVQATYFKDTIASGVHDQKGLEDMIAMSTEMVCKELHDVFHALLKMPQTRTLILSWMGRCLHTFKDRRKLWNNQVLLQTTTLSVNDGFLMNFLAVLLHLSEPFTRVHSVESTTNDRIVIVDKKLLRVDPRYCRLSKSTHANSQAHFLGLAEETFLINNERSPSDSDTTASPEPAQPSFITECFYGTHQALTYGFRSVNERFSRLTQTINDLNHALNDAMTRPLPSNMINDPIAMLKQKFNECMSHFLNLKAALIVPKRIASQMHFCIATAAYLNHLAACASFEEAIDAKEFKVITLDRLRSNKIHKACLEFMPEMLIENILDFFIFLKHFSKTTLANFSNLLEPIMTLIVVYMGNSSLIQNPHLRARFAEILECLMPQPSITPRGFSGCPELFENHPLCEELATSLVHVFVSIEMTGESVQFEQKFSYRRPMYVVLEYLWSVSVHKKTLIKLAADAERDIESARPPLFLRFINLLMNDAIFLLDEALNYMNQLRDAEQRKKSVEWQNLNPQQRHQAEANYEHIGRLARFHNVLSMSTIGTLAWLTSEITTIFSHSTLVDRIANMLNYFLEHLVGPKKGKFNVNDKMDYEFRPKEILEKICQIYINLGRTGNNKKYKVFCSAVSSDGRSYSESLLPKATDILYRTGMSQLATEFEELSMNVERIAVQNKLDEIPIEDIPDTFLDPIMSTLMTDPVMLPSSKIILDRSTIARHLLSDQTDPFNRSPLSMEEVLPQTDLKNQIETFIRDRRNASSP